MNERKDERNNVRSTYLRLVSQSDLNQEGEWKSEKRKTEMKKKDRKDRKKISEKAVSSGF